MGNYRPPDIIDKPVAIISTPAVSGLGSSVQSIATASIAGAASRCSTARANYLRVAAVTAWPMPASKKVRDFAASAGREKSG
jgi:hypothetical protein